MNVKLLACTVSFVALTWLGVSFILPTEIPEDPQFQALLGSEVVSAEHPDSHRLGVATSEVVELPRWEEGAAPAGTLLALLTE